MTSVHLDEEHKPRLAANAKATGVDEAELLRRGVRLVLADGDRPRPHLIDLALRRLLVEPMTRQEALSLSGSGWEGDVDAMRAGAVPRP